MAGWSLSSESLSLDVAEILRKLQSVGFCRHLDVPMKELCREKPGTFFDQMLSVFLKEIYRRWEIRPLPATLGDGRPVDLFEFYSVVLEKGGYSWVTKSQQWAGVSEAIGLDPGVGSLLKLIYIKYLDALDQWIWIVSEKNSGKKSKAMIRGPLCEVPDKKKEEFHSVPPSDSKKDQFLTPSRGNECRVLLGDSVCDNGGMLVEDMGVENGRFSHLKRKRETLVGMLNWLKKLAKNPGDPSIGKLFLKDRAQSKEAHAFGDLYSQVLLARQAMFIKKIRCMSSNGPLMQKGQKVHPSIYEDSIDDNSQNREKIKCSQGLQAVNKQYTPGFSSGASTNPDDDMDEKDFMAVAGENNDIKRRLRNPSLMLDAIADLLSTDRLQKQRVPVDPSFQANVPDWTGKPYETSCDAETLKWLGTRTWPPENQEKKRLLFSQNPIGEGRKDICLCEHPGSVECVRFHVAEKRLQLKCELGPVFYAWRFNHMGEEMSLSWTEEEERKFKDIVRLNPLYLAKNFWHQLYRCFPFKGRKNLVSYYFNVFLLGRRSYQNRVTPNSIDSDDEESEFGLLSNRFGHDAVKVLYPESIVCIVNAQSVDLDDDKDAN